MNKYSVYSSIQDVVDLHNLNGAGQTVDEHDVWNAIEEFLNKMRQKHAQILKKGFVIKVGIVVGKGVRSKNKINGKNPLRFYTEQYLDHCEYGWRNGRVGEGEDGVIVVEFGLG